MCGFLRHHRRRGRERYGIAHEILDARAIRRRFPQFDVRDDEIGYYEYEAGFLRPEACVDAQLALAEKYGAAIRRNEKVLGFEETIPGRHRQDRQGYLRRGPADRQRGRVAAATDRRQIRAAVQGPAAVAVLVCPQGADSAVQARQFPDLHLGDPGPRPQAIYGFPAIDGENGGVKVATQQYETETTPEAVDRSVSDAEAARHV